MHAFNTGDLPTALSYLTQAVDQTPTPPLQTLLARLYVEHLSTPEALTSALELLTHAAHAHYPPALYLLGHYKLSGILQTPHPAGHYFRQAVESKPFPAAAFAYGDCLYHGKGGLEANPEKAFPWIQMAAEASILRAQWRLAHMYREGIGTPVNIERANTWSQRAAKADSRTHAHEPSPAPRPHVKN
jgi:TPR repeat protein